jgi:hypothetical protein
MNRDVDSGLFISENPVVLLVGTSKANSHIPCRAHAVSLPCRAAEGLGLSFLFDLHSAAVIDSHMPRRARAMPRPCRSESDCSTPRKSAAWAWHV